MPVETPPPAREVVRASYQALSEVVAATDDAASWQPTGCRGWAVRDLVFHLLADAQRGLVALHTPASRPADRDSVSYWDGWQSSDQDAANGRRYNRVSASMFLYFDQLRQLYLETAAALVSCATDVDASHLVATQGHVLTAADLLRTLAVEATIHHLDLVATLSGFGGPAASGLAEVRRTLDGLLGHPVEVDWDDVRYATAATGRVVLTDSERLALGADADRFPLFS